MQAKTAACVEGGEAGRETKKKAEDRGRRLRTGCETAEKTTFTTELRAPGPLWGDSSNATSGTVNVQVGQAWCCPAGRAGEDGLGWALRLRPESHKEIEQKKLGSVG